MSWFEALILGLVQGLTEYLPVSSSGHLAIGQALFGMENGEDNLMFTVAVHAIFTMTATAMMTREIVPYSGVSGWMIFLTDSTSAVMPA